MLSRRGFAPEIVIARVCREAGGRVTTNVLLRDLDLEIADRTDARRLEVAVDGLPLFGGAQLAIDATIVSPLRGDGSARRGASGEDCVALTVARRRKERRYLELVAPEAGRCCWSLVWRLEGVGRTTGSGLTTTYIGPQC